MPTDALRGIEAIDAEQGDLYSRRGFLLEAAFHLGRGENVERLQLGQNVTIGDHFVPDEGGGMPDLDRFALSPGVGLASGEIGLGHHPLGLLMEKSGQESEFLVMEAQSVLALRDSAFADDDDLAPRPEGLADHVPFLQRNHIQTRP